MNAHKKETGVQDACIPNQYSKIRMVLLTPYPPGKSEGIKRTDLVSSNKGFTRLDLVVAVVILINPERSVQDILKI